MPLVADLQVLPSPPGNKKQKWKHVDAAIKVIAAFWWQLVSLGKLGCFDECHGKLTHTHTHDMLMEINDAPSSPGTIKLRPPS